MDRSELKISAEDGYLRVDRPANFRVVADAIPCMLDKLERACLDIGVRNILITGPQTDVMLSTTDIFELGKAIAQRRLKVAMVETHNASDRDVAFLETVAFNRGGAIEFFRDEPSALKWLGVG